MTLPYDVSRCTGQYDLYDESEWCPMQRDLSPVRCVHVRRRRSWAAQRRADFYGQAGLPVQDREWDGAMKQVDKMTDYKLVSVEQVVNCLWETLSVDDVRAVETIRVLAQADKLLNAHRKQGGEK